MCGRYILSVFRTKMTDKSLMYFVSCAVFLTILPLPVFTDSGGALSGKRMSCTNENEAFSNHFIKKVEGCFNCICKNGFVECGQETCPAIDDCYTLKSRTQGACCATCQGCEYQNQTISSGTEWSLPDDPCSHFKCLSGVVTQSSLQCYAPCSDPKPPREGQCCPTCLGCYVNGMHVQEGREVMLIGDPCVKCSCSGKRLTCTKKACPALQCPASKQYKRPGACCPICTETIKELDSRHPKGRCMYARNMHQSASKKPFKPDTCSECTCQNGTTVCWRDTCPVLECPVENQIKSNTECCARCLEVSEVRHECKSDGKIYKLNDTWQKNECDSCTCIDGHANCVRTRCPELKCDSNERAVKFPGECCERCHEDPGVCTVYGDPHYKTFDGYHYSFQGTCKYQLTSDCVGHTFSIRVTNDARSRRFSAWTKTVTLKMGHVKVNLGQKMRVKVNGTRIMQYPYDNGAGLRILRDKNEGITVNTELGIVLFWDGNSYLQVQVPTKYKGQLCGLCGNYDLSVREELKARDGRTITELETYEFGNSWRVGGTKACTRKRDAKVAPARWLGNRWRQNQKPVNFAACEQLSGNDELPDNVFARCQSEINPENYYDACKMDMTECPMRHCYCDSFTAYARECQRLGIPVPDWRNRTNCALELMSRKDQLKAQQQLQQQQQKQQRLRHKESLVHFSIPKKLRKKHRQQGRTPPPIQ